ncbi:ankyrin repeat and SAM domain-containing protein 4B isoform X1 [Pantherophis guttatus]|uniref:Ankyrin repeat and SAM domain-containing protein 4B isoform X1 n=1 Tax=Pantherophis guttatus TaxID=94885 RepID=A0A6P9DU98_PANGU|nr:ankyrin repeat and SAM domain-containing protein 4B isoform X1 [Pantherophis guttatus]
MSTRFHRAAADGNLELLKEATRKDLNTADADGMTPTLLVAYHGNVEALEIVCRRGGDPNVCDIWGNTPLHHAASNGHTPCVSFLINFGANIFALDNDMRSPLDAAASRSQYPCVQILDKAATEQNVKNPKRVARLKAQAQREVQRQIRLCEKRQDKHQLEMSKQFHKGSIPLSHSSATRTKVSQFFATGSLSDVPKQLKDTFKLKSRKKEENSTAGSRGAEEDGFTGEITAMDSSSEKEVEDLMCGFQKKISFSEEAEDLGQRSIFNRPGLGNLVFRSQKTETLLPEKEDRAFQIPELFQLKEALGGSDNEDDPDVSWMEEAVGWDEDKEEAPPLEVFLVAHHLHEFLPILMRENIDLESLMLCSDEDLQSIQMQLGPRKKVLHAISKRKLALEKPGLISDTQL